MKVWNGGQMLLYVPKVEEDISDVVRKHTLKQCGSKSLGSPNGSTITSDDDV